jgi:acyl-CoA thioesterase-1
MEIRSSATILFQGDSITDADRNRRKTLDLGTGYVMMVAERFSAKYPERKVTFLNRGLSGNRVRDLRNRWRKDCLDLKPNVVSIMIGVNDVLGGYFWNSLTSVEEFEDDYRMILQQTSDLLGVKIVLLEPFMLSAAKNQFGLGEDLDNRVKITRKLSKEFGTYLVPLNKIFEDAERIRDPSFWSADGIHPTLAGHALIAQNWLKTIDP